MFTFRSVLDVLREFALSCAGSPHSRSRQLAALRKLDAHLLMDIGLTPEDMQQGDPLRAPAAEDRPRRTVRLEIRGPYPNR